MSELQQSSDKKNANKVLWGAVGAVLGLIIGAVGVYFAFRQTAVTEKAYDRGAGRITAKLELKGVSPEDAKIPARFWGKTKFGGESVYFEDHEKLLALNFTVRVKNTGEEPIEALRVETRFVGGVIDTVDCPPEVQKKKTPWVIRQAEREEYALSQKLMPGQEAQVTLVRGLVGQMVQAQATDERVGKDHLGHFEVQVYARIVGGTSFDGADRVAGISFVWVPKGFSAESCKKIQESMQPHVEVLR